MKIKIKDINDAKKICFSIEIIKKSDIVIDKVLNKIFEKYSISTLDANTPDEALKELSQMI